MDPIDFASLISPLPLTDFCSQYWGQKVFATKLGDQELESLQAGFFDGDLVEVLKECRNEENVPHTAEEMTGFEQDLEGARKTINMPFCFTPGAVALRSSFLESCAELGNDIEVGVYASHPGGDIANWHFDNNHNITIQLYGQKDWNYMPGSPNTVGSRSLAGDTAKNRYEQQRLTPSPNDESVQCFSLVPGSVIYVPPGHWHQVTPIEGSSLAVDIRVANLLQARWIAEAVFSGLLQQFDYANTALHSVHSQEDMQQQLQYVAASLPSMLLRTSVPRCLAAEPNQSNGMNRGATLEHLREKHNFVSLAHPQVLVGVNLLVAISFKLREIDQLMVQLHSVSSLSTMEYLNFKILCPRAVLPALRRLANGGTTKAEELVMLGGSEAQEETRNLVEVLLYANVLWQEEADTAVESKPKRAKMQ